MEKIFMSIEDIANDLDIDNSEAGKLVVELHERIRQKRMCIAKLVPVTFYESMKSTGFLSSEGVEPDDYPLKDKRLLRLNEFCAYSGTGQHVARKLAKEIGIQKRIGRRVLYDRELFDRWCDENTTTDI